VVILKTTLENLSSVEVDTVYQNLSPDPERGPPPYFV